MIIRKQIVKEEFKFHLINPFSYLNEAQKYH